MERETVTQSDFARLMGVTVEAVTKAMKAGRLKDAIIRGRRGPPRIDPELGRQEWEANTSPSKGGNRMTAKPAELHEDGDTAAASYAKSRAKREAYAAELARLEVQEKLGTLVDADEVKRAAFSTARQIRDGLLNMPDRLAAELAAMTDQFEIHRVLTEEIRRVLTDSALKLGEEND